MSKRKPEPIADRPLELEDFVADPSEDLTPETLDNAWRRAPLWARALGTAIVTAIVLVASFEFVYAGKIFPGVTVDGVYVGGLSKKEASRKLEDRLQTFAGEVVTISHKDTHLRIPVASMGVVYDADTVINEAMSYGRRGGLRTQIREQARAIAGQPTPLSNYIYPDALLTPYLVELSADLTTPVENAKLSFGDKEATVTPAQPGTRLDTGRLTHMVADRLANTSTESIKAPVYKLAPTISTDQLAAATSQINDYLGGPITVTYSGTDRRIEQDTIISWIDVTVPPTRSFFQTMKVENLYSPPPAASLGLSPAAVKNYVKELADGIDQTAQNATLAMTDGQLTIMRPSQDGIQVDQPGAVLDIISALKKSGSDRKVSLKLQTARAEVNEENLGDLGIKELLATGETMFPGSTTARMTNIRVGAKRFNNVLLKPGEVFSFGKILGAVGPEQGYLPELVILGDHEEKQYGGGLCQVASTAYRAALLSGLPIKERHNHSFAVSYYTAPFGAPGVDATIYYPQVDFKFQNDSPAYILIQTVMEGSNLKFHYFGTKVKSGQIRGPEFVTGTNDATKPSHTVFYRDVN
jgi:vancomycin resistance protein YoaR